MLISSTLGLPCMPCDTLRVLFWVMTSSQLASIVCVFGDSSLNFRLHSRHIVADLHKAQSQPLLMLLTAETGHWHQPVFWEFQCNAWESEPHQEFHSRKQHVDRLTAKLHGLTRPHGVPSIRHTYAYLLAQDAISCTTALSVAQ